MQGQEVAPSLTWSRVGLAKGLALGLLSDLCLSWSCPRAAGGAPMKPLSHPALQFRKILVPKKKKKSWHFFFFFFLSEKYSWILLAVSHSWSSHSLWLFWAAGWVIHRIGRFSMPCLVHCCLPRSFPQSTVLCGIALENVDRTWARAAGGISVHVSSGNFPVQKRSWGGNEGISKPLDLSCPLHWQGAQGTCGSWFWVSEKQGVFRKNIWDL